MNFSYLASKIFAYLVLSPLIFVIFFLAASFYAKKFRIVFIAISLSFYALSIPYVSNSLLLPLEKPYNKVLAQNNSVNAVVVLSGGSVEGSANIPIASDAYKRAMWGLMIAKSQNLPLLFSGAGLEIYSEADAFLDSMKEIKNNLHVDMPISSALTIGSFSLHVENRSLNTYQNAQFSKEAFENIGIDRPTVYLVTSAFHMKRSITLFEHFGFEVIPAATSFRLDNKAEEVGLLSFLPKFSSLNNSYIALHEYTGLISLALQGII